MQTCSHAIAKTINNNSNNNHGNDNNTWLLFLHLKFNHNSSWAMERMVVTISYGNFSPTNVPFRGANALLGLHPLMFAMWSVLVTFRVVTETCCMGMFLWQIISFCFSLIFIVYLAEVFKTCAAFQRLWTTWRKWSWCSSFPAEWGWNIRSRMLPAFSFSKHGGRHEKSISAEPAVDTPMRHNLFAMFACPTLQFHQNIDPSTMSGTRWWCRNRSTEWSSPTWHVEPLYEEWNSIPHMRQDLGAL